MTRSNEVVILMYGELFNECCQCVQFRTEILTEVNVILDFRSIFVIAIHAENFESTFAINNKRQAKRISTKNKKK